MFNWLWRLIGKLTGWERETEEYWERFILPQIDRARMLGFSDDEIGVMLQTALDQSDMMARQLPGGMLRDMIDSAAPAAESATDER